MLDRVITVLYGSETGTAQDTAEQIWKLAKRCGIKCSVSAMDDYNVLNLVTERIVIFVIATTGQGDNPANTKKFWKFLLRKNLPPNSLVNVKYAVLGLGDSSYQKFNFAAKKLNKRLAQLGGKEIIPIGLADDQHDLGIDAVVGPWTESLWDSLKLDSKIHENEVIERYGVKVINEILTDTDVDIYSKEALVTDALICGTVIDNIRTTTIDHFQDVRLIKLKASHVEYSPGDIVYIRPKNSKVQVDKFFSVLKENGVHVEDMVIEVSEKEIKVPIVLQQKLSLKQVAEHYWDLNFKPRRSTMEILASISDNELEKEKLVEFTTAAGQEELFDYVNRPRRNIVEVLNDFPHTTKKLTENLLFEIMSPIKPRAFSIASSSKKDQNEVHLLVAVVKYKTKLFEPRLGLCSNWLAGLKPGDKTYFWVQKGTFDFHLDKPMILIGPGTGVAPFRSLLLEKSISGDLESCILFFGCRNEAKDFHCQEDFQTLTNQKKLRLFCAFSRDQDEKVYVQHIIRKQGSLCWKLLEAGACIYLAGSSKNMPEAVRDEFVALAKTFGKLTDDGAANFVNNLEKYGRYQTETWA